MTRPKYLPDNFTLALLAVVAAASVLPCSGRLAGLLNSATNMAVALLFFLHGAKLSREAIISGLTHWRLHAVVMISTFALFPLLGLALKPALLPLVTPDLYLGVLFLCTLPSTVQSSIAFTSMARGNIAAAVCSASASSLLGIFLTPLLVGLMVSPQSGAAVSLDSVIKIIVQLLLPFILGQIARRWIGAWIARHPALLRPVDQGSILLVVYTAFSAAVVEGLWRQVSLNALVALVAISLLLLAIVLLMTWQASRRLGFSKEDEITIVFCGSKKSLASGVPIAKVLFPPQAIGLMILPLMLFHQIQLMVCAVLAQRYAARPASP